jgi:hypothetical protein
MGDIPVTAPPPPQPQQMPIGLCKAEQTQKRFCEAQAHAPPRRWLAVAVELVGMQVKLEKVAGIPH